MTRTVKMLTRIVFAATVFAAARSAHALDVVSGASMGRNMVTVSAITTTTTSASLTYSEAYTNGTFRFYYSTTAFASSSDTTRATVTKMNVSTRGRGTLTLSGLVANTTYYFRFQGYYQKGTANYWATGSFATSPLAGLTSRLPQGARSSTEVANALGRPRSGAAGVGFRQGAAIVAPRSVGR